MKKLLLLLFTLSFLVNETKAQTWAPVPGYQISYNDVIGVTRHQGNIWAQTRIGIYKIVGSNWQLTSGDFTVSSQFGCMYSDGTDLYAGGLFTFGSNNVLVIKWDGTSWIPVAYTNDFSPSRILTILKTNNNLYVGGFFNSIGSTPLSINNSLNYWAVFDGSSWSQPFSVTTTGCSASIESIQLIGDSIYVGGGFNEIGGVWTPGTFKFKEGGSMSVLSGYGSCAIGRDYVFYKDNFYIGGKRPHDIIGVDVGITKRSGSSWASLSSTMQLTNTRIGKIFNKLFIAGEPGNGLGGIKTNIVMFDGSVFVNRGLGISYPNSLNVYPKIHNMFVDTIGGKIYVAGNFMQSDGNVSDNFAVTDFTIVPVNLSYFTAKVVGADSIVLNWRDETPEDGVKFEVQMSTDGRNFRTIGQVIEQGSRKDYSFVYSSLECGKIFFRLAFEGKYSEIRSVTIPCDVSMISDNQSLRIQTTYTGTLTITSISGQTLARTVLASGYRVIPLSLAPGMYIAQFIDTQGNRYTQKIVVQ